MLRPRSGTHVRLRKLSGLTISWIMQRKHVSHVTESLDSKAHLSMSTWKEPSFNLESNKSFDVGARDSHMTLTASPARKLHMRACAVCGISFDTAADSKED